MNFNSHLFLIFNIISLDFMMTDRLQTQSRNWLTGVLVGSEVNSWSSSPPVQVLKITVLSLPDNQNTAKSWSLFPRISICQLCSYRSYLTISQWEHWGLADILSICMLVWLWQMAGDPRYSDVRVLHSGTSKILTHHWDRSLIPV